MKKINFFPLSGCMVLLILFFSAALYGQRAKKERVLSPDEAKVVKKDASVLFSTLDFNGALKGYQELIKADPENPEYNYRLGVCILQTTSDKSTALPYLLLNSQSKDAKKEIDYYLGLAHMHKNEWDLAITSFQDYKTKVGGKGVKDLPPVDRLLEMCDNGKELCKHILNVSFENLGKLINTEYDEYNPQISADGNYLAFTTRRKGNIGGFVDELGIYTADIYWSGWKDTIWSKARSFGGLVNGEWDEELVSLSPAGDQALIYYDNVEFFADIGYTTLRGKSWLRPEMFSATINTKYPEGAACVSMDGSTLYFSSNRKDGFGGSDLWMSKLNPDGTWGHPENLGSEINSTEDDDFPWITMDGKTMYFASKGHNSMGDFDIFRSHLDKTTGKWSSPQNLGCPINTADDNHTISFTGDGRFAYISATGMNSFGSRDIFKVEFKDTTDHPFKTLIRGTIQSEIGKRIKITKVSLENIETMEVQSFVPQGSGNNFVLNASPGNYRIIAEGSDFVTTTVDIVIENNFPPLEVNQEIIVKSTK